VLRKTTSKPSRVTSALAPKNLVAQQEGVKIEENLYTNAANIFGQNSSGEEMVLQRIRHALYWLSNVRPVKSTPEVTN
jgi:hypothetical protein